MPVSSPAFKLSLIRPSLNPICSGALYAWLTMRGKEYRLRTSRVYICQSGHAWIGLMDGGDFIGAQLKPMLECGSVDCACDGGVYEDLVLQEWTDFWQLYVEHGTQVLDFQPLRSVVPVYAGQSQMQLSVF